MLPQATPIVEYDMNTRDGWIDHRPQAPGANAAPDVRAQWRALVAEIAQRAKEKLPACAGRIDLAVKLVLAGDVELHADGTATVASGSDPAVQYTVNGACECGDYPKAPDGWCKHRLGRAIMQRARTALALRLEQKPVDSGEVGSGEVGSGEVGSGEVASGEPSDNRQPTTANCSLPEAPVSANAFVVIDGHRVQVTVRGTTWRGVLTELRQVLAAYPATETPAPDAAPASGPTPCPEHGAAKIKPSKFGGHYCAAQKADGTYCSYKTKD